MGRPPKKGIDYSGWSVTIFDNDTKIDKLLDAHGWDGFGIYFYLCQRAYGGEGYFYKWSYDDCASTSRKMGGGIGSGTVKETVDYCLQIGLFDKGLFDRWGVLTSRGIQRRYWEVVKARDVRTVISDYWLLQDNECKGLIKTPLNSDFQEEKDNFQEGNHSFQEGNGSFHYIKKRKEKESREENNNTMCKADALALFEQLWQLYPYKKGKGQVSNSEKEKLLDIGYEEMVRAINRYKIEFEKDSDWRKPQNGSTFFNKGYIDYLDDNYVPSPDCKAKARKNKFNNFNQRSYNDEEFERMLLERSR